MRVFVFNDIVYSNRKGFDARVMIDFSYHKVKDSNAVMLQVDLSRYIKTIYKIEEAIYTLAVLQMCPPSSPHMLILHQMRIFFQQQLVQQYQKSFQAFQLRCSNVLHHLSGHMHWWYLQELLAHAIVPTTKLAEYLQEILLEFMSGRKPLVIEVLQRFFVELIENAINAKVRQCLDTAAFLRQPLPDFRLKMQVELKINRDGYLFARVMDNAGGFSSEFLSHWSHRLRHRNVERDLVWFAHEKGEHYALCGQHQTLRRMMVNLLDGIEMEECGLYYERYCIKPRDTAFRLYNRPDGQGAVIEMVSPITPPALLYPSPPALSFFKASPDTPPDSPPVVEKPQVIAGDLNEDAGPLTALI